MKISNNTINILKNFSTINSSIKFKKGDSISTISPYGVIFGEAKLEESFPRDIAIYDLNKFLGIQSMMQDPEFDFKEDHVVITNKNQSVNFVYADPSTVKSLNKKITMPESSVSVDVSETDLRALTKAAAIMGLPELSIAGNGKNVVLTVLDTKNDSLGTFVVETEQKTAKKFEVVLKVENLKIVDGAYNISLSSDIVNFKNNIGNLQYWVAVEANSGL